jgi:hypothetical protein
MEELLLPVFDGISNQTPTKVMVFRPYGMKWDSLSVSSGPTGDGWRVVRWNDGGNTHWTATLQGTHLLWVRRSDHPDNQKVALEGTATRAAFDRIRQQVESASRPARPNER